MKTLVLALVGITAAIFIAQSAWSVKQGRDAAYDAERAEARQIINEELRKLGGD